MAAFPVTIDDPYHRLVREEYEEAQIAATVAHHRARILLVIAKRWHALSSRSGRVLFTQTEKLRWDEDAETLRSLERLLEKG